MTVRIVLNESSASKRCVPIMCFQSNGTSACTNESGRTFMFSVGGAFYGSGGSISVMSAVDGMYMCNFSASKVSVLGQGMVQYSSNTALPWMTPFEIVNEDPWTSGVTLNPGLYSNVTVRIEGVDYSGLTIKGVTNYKNFDSVVTLAPGTHSGATVAGADNLGRRTYSDLTVRIEGVDYSNLTIQGVKRVLALSANDDKTNYGIAAGSYSGVTIDGLSNKTFFQTSVQSSVWSGKRSDWTTPGSFGEYVYSQVTGTSSGTVQGVTRTLSLSANDDKTGYGVTSIAAAVYSGVTIDGLSNKTFFQTSVQSSVWSGKRSDWTTPGSFGEYVYSQVTGTSGGTVQGILNFANISDVTLHAGTHSGATIQGLNRLNSSVTLNADTHSAATIGGIGANGIVASSLAGAVITSAKFAAGAIDAVALATDAGQEIADRILLRGIEGGNDSDRSVGQALAVLRNKVGIDGSTVTVYRVDDVTSLWTGTVSTSTLAISGVDPVGP